MLIETEYQGNQTHLIAKSRGQWETTAAKQTIAEIQTEAQKQGFRRVLLDMREISAPHTEMTRFYSGEYAAQVWGPYLKVAVLAKPQIINKFAEDVGVNRGANFRVFTDCEIARQWLLSGYQGPNPDKGGE